MSRYDIPLDDQTAFEPGSNELVLRNKMGIINPELAEQIEAELLRDAQLKYYEEVDLMGITFTSRFIQTMHRDWLEKLYDWAGKYRKEEMSKGSVAFAPAFRVSENMELLETSYLARLTPCTSMSVNEVAYAMAEVRATLVFIHPFREGNGRLARWLATLMAVQAGYPPPLYVNGSGIESTRNRYFEAMRRGYIGSYEDLASFFEESIKSALEDSESR